MTKASESQKISFSNALFENSGNQNQLSVTPQFSVLESQNYAENEIIIKFKSGLNADLQSFAANTLQSSMQATLASTTQSLGSQLWQIKGMSVEAAIAAYQDHPSIEYIQPNYQLQLANSADAAPSREGHLADLATDPGMASLWGLHNTGQTGGTVDADIDAPEAWDLSLGRDVVVGVIDSGVDYTHPDLDDNIWINSGEIAGNGIDDDGNGYVDDYIGYDFVSGDADPYDENGHGTHVAGTIAAEANNGLGVVGVAPEAKIMALKIFDAQGNTNAFAAIQAIEYATMMGADITNNSWGGGSYSQALYDAIAAAEQAGQVFVAAAGNGGFDGIGDNNDFFPNYPSNYDVDNIIAVGASDHSDFLGGFSNYGASTVDITAPGVDIVSTVPGGYDTFSGTSMATPHVAGVAALLLAQDPDLTPQEVRQILIDSADPVAVQAGATVADGRLNAYSALSGIQSQAGSIQGSVWHDVDEDGIWDANEAALNDWTIYLDQNQNGQLDSGEQSAVTDTSGSYSFTGLAAGQYTVAEVVPTGWEQTSPSSHETNVFSTSAQILPSISTTGSTTAIQTYGEVVALDPELQITPQTDISGPLINIDDFRQDNRFAGIDGSGFATVILDSGIDLDHSFFGPDTNGDGISDRIVYQYDFADEDADASDVDGHGSNVSSIVASSDSVHTGMAPGADIIHLKVFGDDGSGNFADVEQALQWVVDNAANYNIASVNMSLGDTSNWNTAQSQYGLGDELAALAAMDVITVSASGNDFYGFNSEQGVSYPAADPNSLSVGATFDRDMGSVSWLSGAEAYFSDADQVTPISQRHETLTSIFAPGAPITGAGADGGLVSMTGTSQAAPHIAGVAALAQQLAQDTLGRRLTLDEFSNLLVTSGVTVNDGDDEYDNVTNTGLNFKRVDVFALGEAILALNSNASVPGTHTVTVTAGETVTDINFGNRQLPTSSATNFSFETGDFSGWQVQGDGTLQTSSIGVAPTDGTYQALMTTDATAGAITAGNLETFLGLEDNALSLLGNGIAIEGSALQLDAFTVEAGAVLTFDWNFLTGDDTPDLTANDFGFVSLSNGFGTELADTFGDFTSFTGSTFDQHTGYGTYHYTFATAGTYTLGIGVVDANSSAGTSGLLVDNITIVSNIQTADANFSFETGDFSGWQIQGDSTLQTSNISVAPTDGTYQALMTTDATAGAITASDLETFLGLEDNALNVLGNGIAMEGSALKLDAFTVEAGDVLTFDWNFLTDVNAPALAANDFGFVALSNGFETELADTLGDFTAFTGVTFDQHTGYGTYHYTFAAAGTYTLGIGVVGASSSTGTSGLLVDNIELISFSETESILNLGSETDDATGGENTGEDLLLGSNSQNDILYGGSGNDTLAGKQGDDTLYGEAGDDVLRGDDNSSAAGGITGGNDVLYGGAGHDRLGGKAGDDVLYGESGDDQMWGDDGDDILWGGAGNNTLMGDDFSGGSGHDTFVLTAEAGVDTILDFEIGVDVIGLAGDLTFEALTFAGNTIRHDEAVLAVLDGVDTQTLTTDSFTHV